jgi:cholesterol transport system auxiliary component
MIKPVLVLIALIPLSACISFGGKAPPSLLTLTPANNIAANETRTARAGDTIVIAVPNVPQAIATTRVAVNSGATAIAYIKNAVWVEAPARLFQRVLSETIAVKNGKMVIDARQSLSIPSLQLGGTLLRFGIDSGTSEAVVVYDALLSRGKDMPLQSRRFETRVPVSAIEPAPAGRALNQAANKVAIDVAGWIGYRQGEE